MSVSRISLLIAAALSMSGVTSAAPQSGGARSDTPVATARRVTGPITLDGRLTESDWRTMSIGPLTQREPLEGQPAVEDTEVRVLYDEHALYIGIVCHEGHAGGIVSTQLTRDAELDVDDRVTIVLDPFFDHRNGFFFQTSTSACSMCRRAACPGRSIRTTSSPRGCAAISCSSPRSARS